MQLYENKMPPVKKKNDKYICYCLKSVRGNKTYVGITNNWTRRLRQHCGELKGGARYTRGCKWRGFFHVSGFTKRQALQFEWAMKHRRKGSRLTGRCKTLWFLLGLERWTKKAPRVQDLKLNVTLKCSRSEFCKLARIEKFDLAARVSPKLSLTFNKKL